MERDEDFTVKSAYRMLAGEELDVGVTSDWEREKWLWTRLWKVPVWPRVKLFFWQLCGEALPTKANIVSRVGGEFPSCTFCSFNCETSIHLFRDCRSAQRVWAGLNLEGEVEECGGGARDWVEARWRELGCVEQGRFMVGCWALWEHRNKVVFEGEVADHVRVIGRVRDVMEEIGGGGEGMRGQGEVELSGMGENGPTRWKAAQAGYVKVNVDAGVKEEDGVGVGAVCRDGAGAVKWGVSRVWKEVWEPHVAEAVAVLEGITEAARRGHTHVVIESDCKQVIDALEKKKKGRSIFYLVLDDIWSLLSSFHSVIWSYTNRVNNSVAHALGHLFPRVVGRNMWSDVLPPIANIAVIADSLLI
ncbi:uncharacterized protein LOC141607671 [Silene latifolia]|uniref:uncharacterized protein LOC141607671 n=1 Tax=Silene latifolia TaxID=37657 RepID=UPI003D783EA8